MQIYSDFPLLFWAIISLFSDHNQYKRRFCAEIDSNNISSEDAINILHLSGVCHSIVHDIQLCGYNDGDDGGGGYIFKPITQSK